MFCKSFRKYYFLVSLSTFICIFLWIIGFEQEVIAGGKRVVFSHQGSSERKISLKAKDLEDAINQGREIDVAYATIDGDLTLTGRGEIKSKIAIRNSNITGRVTVHSVTFLDEVDFEGTVFESSVEFTNTIFKEKANFEFVDFNERSSFQKVVFREQASFLYSSFKGIVEFSGATFHKIANFFQSKFEDRSIFLNTRFKGWARFSKSKFAENVSFSPDKDDHSRSSAIFEKDAEFYKAIFLEKVSFYKVFFAQKAAFGSAIFEGDANFKRANFGGLSDFVRSHFIGDKVDFTEAIFFKYAFFSNINLNRKDGKNKEKEAYEKFVERVKKTGKVNSQWNTISNNTNFIFQDASFLDVADFRNSHFAQIDFASGQYLTSFKQDVDFSNAIFGNDNKGEDVISFDINRVIFYGNVSFEDSIFRNNLDFQAAEFRKTANFRTSAKENIPFKDVKCIKMNLKTKFERIIIDWDMWLDKNKKPKIELGDENQKDIFYQLLEKTFRNSDDLKNANDIYYMRKESKQGAWNKVEGLLFGYWVRFTHIAGLSVVIILLFSAYYFLKKSVFKDPERSFEPLKIPILTIQQDNKEDLKPWQRLWWSLCLSFNVFTKFGLGAKYHTNSPWCYRLIKLEWFLGWIVIALFMYIVSNINPTVHKIIHGVL